MKCIEFFLTLLVIGLSLTVQAQESQVIEMPKNRIDLSYSNLFSGVVVADGRGGSFRGGGLEIAYSRYLFKDRGYARIAYGRIYAWTDDAEFLEWLADNQFRVSVFSVGVGYDVIKEDKFRLGLEAGFLNLRFWSLHHIDSYPPTYQYGKNSDGTIYAQLLLQYNLTPKLVLTPALMYGFDYNKYKTSWAKIGLGYRF